MQKSAINLFDHAAQLIEALQRDVKGFHTFSVGIDGIDGVGKTPLAQSIAQALNVPLIALDDFLERGRGTYVDNLRMNEIAQRVNCDRFVIEGVCLLEVVARLDIPVSHLVYMKCFGPYGDWRDENECDPAEPVDELIARLDGEARAFGSIVATIEGRDSIEKDESGLTPFRSEVIRYHAMHRPSHVAQYELRVFPEMSDESSRRVGC